jgi:hypothetical protein
LSSLARKSTADPRIRQIEDQQKAIEKYIGNVLFDLGRLDRGELVDYWVHIKNSGKSTSYRRVLEDRLAQLRRHMRQLNRQKRDVRIAVLRNTARKIGSTNRIAARKILQRAEKRGELTSDEERKLVQYARQTMRASLRLLDKNPSRRNIRAALNAAGDYMKAGGDESGSKEAFKALAKAAARRYRRAEHDFRKNPNGQNLKRLLRAHAQGDVLCQGFMEFPPKPQGLRVSWPERTHVVKKGETLPTISKLYYGSEEYWDIIFVANYGLIGDNYKHLRPDVALYIPGNKY